MNTPFWRGEGKASRFMDPKEIAAAIVDAMFRPGIAVTELVINRP